MADSVYNPALARFVALLDAASSRGLPDFYSAASLPVGLTPQSDWHVYSLESDRIEFWPSGWHWAKERVRYFVGEAGEWAARWSARECFQRLLNEIRKVLLSELNKRVDDAGIDLGRVEVCFDNPVDEILRKTKSDGIDLIVLGSHGRQGGHLMLGSTANAVLHRAECDVLAVRIAASEVS